jgi:hypothetical protein
MSGNSRQLSLGAIVTSLPTVRAARKINTGSRVQRRLIEPVDGEQDIAFQHSILCQISLPYQDHLRGCAAMATIAGKHISRGASRPLT